MIDLPAPISAYFAADAKDGATLAQCFTETAVVKDEHRIHSGREAIQAWRTEAAAKYSYTSEPHTVTTEDGGITIVTSRLTGNFPGSPVDLRFFFRLEGDKILRLEITP